MASYRLLFVDDEPQFLNALQEWFTNHGYEVQVASDGLEAVAMCEKFDFDLVTLDLDMPRMNGLEAARTLRQRYPHLPILILSAAPTHEAALEAFGVAEILLKPISLHVLARHIRDHLAPRV